MKHRYTLEQKTFIRDNVKGRLIPDLTAMVNEKFDLELKDKQIRAFVKNHKLSSGVKTVFQRGHTPFNKGRKGVGGWKPTQFQKGHRPHNYKPVGSERVNGDDYVDVKIADPNKWRGKHLIEWERHNGHPVPKNYAVIFGDGNRRNFAPDNLLLVTRGQLAIMNKRGLIQHDADLTRMGIVMADIYKKIGERKRGT